MNSLFDLFYFDRRVSSNRGDPVVIFLNARTVKPIHFGSGRKLKSGTVFDRVSLNLRTNVFRFEDGAYAADVPAGVLTGQVGSCVS
jgi:hypothetical protein